MLRRVLVLLVALILVGCAGERPTPEPTQTPFPTRPPQPATAEAEEIPASDGATTRPQFLNSFASW